MSSSRLQPLDGYMSDGDVAFFNANGTPKTIGATASAATAGTASANCMEASAPHTAEIAI